MWLFSTDLYIKIHFLLNLQFYIYIYNQQTVKGKFTSLNTRGIGNYCKRRTIFTWLRKQKPDIVFLQETHSTQGNEIMCKREWGATLFCSHGKWAKLREEFDLVDKQLSEAFIMPVRVAYEPYLRSFQYKVLNSILYKNDLLCKIEYVSNPNCCFFSSDFSNYIPYSLQLFFFNLFLE